MKMGAGTFWGLFLIFIGTALILKVLFHIQLPIAKIAFAAFFILIGFKILLGNFRVNNFKTSGNDAIFKELRVHANNFNYPEYNIIFGKGEFDLRGLDLSQTGTKYVKIASIFSGSEIILDNDIPVKISTESVFSGGKLPEGNTTAFGTSTYISSNFDPVKPHLNLRVELIFSGLDVKRR